MCEATDNLSADPTPRSARRNPRRRRTRVVAATAGALLALLSHSAAAAQEAATLPATAPATTAVAVPADQPRLFADLPADGRVRLMVNKSTVLSTTAPYKTISVAQPTVADVTPIGPTQILVTAKGAGSTQLMVWDDAGRTQVTDVVVAVDASVLQDQLNAMFPGARIEVVDVNGAVALRGRVPNLQAAEQAAQVAEPYASRVLNFLEVAGGQQVMLEVKFAEVSRSATNALGVNLGLTDGTAIGGSNIGQVAPFGFAESQVNPDSLLLGVPQTLGESVTLFGRGEVGSTAFHAFVSALRQNNLLRVLAEPNLVTVSGQEAEFIAGGEFPVPVPQAGTGGNSTITIEYREFGVKLKFVPVVLGDGKIRLKVSPEVSDLDFTAAVRIAGTQVPGLRKRNLTTTIEMTDGQTFAVAGLLDSSVTASKDVTPLLGDVPVLGALFRSVRYQRRETELVVLVTPHIVAPMNPDQVPALPGEHWRHPNEAELFWNRDLGGEVQASPGDRAGGATAGGPPPRFHGQYGFTPAAATAAAPGVASAGE
jgi:pilus assembly protein CpaC